jgi:glycosyltransferase involved in cell wall biosynthesis
MAINTQYPFVSVIIPARDEEKFIGNCLSRIVGQTYPKTRMEVLVIDGLSRDMTREIVKNFRAVAMAGLGPAVRLIDNPKGQRTTALNIGIQEAKGDVVLRVDARTVIKNTYIEDCVKTLFETGAANSGGVQRPIVEAHGRGGKGREITQYAVGIALSNAFGIGNAQFRLGGKSGFVDTVYLGCFRKEVFSKTGPFDDESAVISEDADMNMRIREAGEKVYLNSEIEAYYYPRDTVSSLARLYFRYGGAKAGLLLKRGRLTAWRQFVPPTFLLSFSMLPVAGIIFRPFHYLWLLIAGLYMAADLAVSSRLALRNKGAVRTPNGLDIPKPFAKAGFFGLFLRFMLIFPAMHFSWALGFLRRIIQRPAQGQYWGN